MRDDVFGRSGLQRYLRLYVEGFLFFFNPGANILLLAVEPNAVSGSARLSILFNPCGYVRVVCVGSAAALVFGFFRFGAWLASSSCASASPA